MAKKTSAAKEPKAKQRRSYALDALRGYAILTMVLSGLVPATIPAWMHHAQVPPPDFKFNPNLPGITWVDLVFPFFLFSMGAAFPMALSSRIEKGVQFWKISLGIVTRCLLLLAFSIYVENTQPWVLGYSEVVNNLLGLLAFVFVFAALVRLPDSWAGWKSWGIKLLGFAGGVALVLLAKRADHAAFDWSRNDCIIRILAFVCVSGSFVWLCCRKSLLARLGVLGVLIAFRLSAATPGWVQAVNGKSYSIPFFDPGMLHYLFIVVPAMIVGDMILAWMKSPDESIPDRKPWTTARLVSIVGLMLAFFGVMLVGLFTRMLWQTTLAGFAMCGIGWWLLSKPSNGTEKLLNNIYNWGAYCLILGLTFEPYEGGIKKDCATMSYYFVSAGLAIFMLIAFTIIIDVFRKRRWLQLLIDNGQNPMIAYIGRFTLVLPLLYFTRINPLMDKLFVSPWAGFVHAVITTLIIALVVSVFTKKRVFWRT